MKSLILLISVVLFSLFISGCGPVHRPMAPLQNLPPLAPGNTTCVMVVNPVFTNIEFYRGPLAGLILGHFEQYPAELPWGYQEHCWSYEAVNGRVHNYCQKIIVTHRSKTLKIIPPREDNAFGVRGRGTLDLNDY
jgi:hypothetical protein